MSFANVSVIAFHSLSCRYISCDNTQSSMNLEAAELLEILTRSDLEGVCLAFDQILKKEKEKGTPFTTTVLSTTLTAMTTTTTAMTSNTMLPPTTTITAPMTTSLTAPHFVDPLTGQSLLDKNTHLYLLSYSLSRMHKKSLRD